MSAAPLPILVLAAGASKRMRGADKLLMDVDGIPLLRHVVLQAVATHHPVMVAMSDTFPERFEALNGIEHHCVRVPCPERGMSKSLKTGLESLEKTAPAILIALADMPEITTRDYLSLIHAFGADATAPIVRACSNSGQAGNPVILPRWALNLLTLNQADQGARGLIKQFPERVKLVPLPDQHAVQDLDTPDDWAHWRKNRYHCRT